LLKFLLTIPYFDPSRNNKTVFKTALFEGRHKIVKLLAADHRVNMDDSKYNFGMILQHEEILYGIIYDEDTNAIIEGNREDIPNIGILGSESMKTPFRMMLDAKGTMSKNHRKCFRALLQSPQFIKTITLDEIKLVCDNFIDYKDGENKIAFMSEIDGISEKMQVYKSMITDISSHRKRIKILLTKNHPSCDDTDGIISSFVNDK
jgi:hypothetical protein